MPLEVSITIVTPDNASAIFGHAISKPPKQAVEFVAKLISRAPLIPEQQLAGMAVPLLSNLRGELSEPSYNALSVVLGSVMKQVYLREQGLVAPNGFVPAAALYGILPGFRDATPDDPEMGTPTCPCLNCSLQRARGETPTPGATRH